MRVRQLVEKKRRLQRGFVAYTGTRKPHKLAKQSAIQGAWTRASLAGANTQPQDKTKEKTRKSHDVS
jgi:hypothetical protein